MKTIISASRRTDLPAFFPDWLAGRFREGRARVLGPRGKTRDVDLRPEAVHTVVLWSKDFSPLLRDVSGLRRALERYDQIYLLFTVTGLGGTVLERAVPEPARALAQLPDLVALAGHPRRVSLRFDPVVFWREGGRSPTAAGAPDFARGFTSAVLARDYKPRASSESKARPLTNLGFFAAAAEAAARAGIRDVRFSLTQWYGKALRRTRGQGLEPVDPPVEEKIEAASRIAAIAARWNLNLFACSQDFLTRAPGVRPSSCIDGRLLTELHPRKEDASRARDRTQRRECGCTASIDIGSYSQVCDHACVYCYAGAPK